MAEESKPENGQVQEEVSQLVPAGKVGELVARTRFRARGHGSRPLESRND